MKLFVLARIFPLNVAFRFGLALALLWPSVFNFTLSGANQYPAGSLTNPFSLPAYQGIHQVNGQVDAAFRLMPSTAGSPQWWSTVQENIRKSEYNATWQEGTSLAGLAAAYQAPNRAQNFRTYFSPEGVRLIPRVRDETGNGVWQLGLTLSGIGYGAELCGVAAPDLVVVENRAEYRRGEIAEWYVNDHPLPGLQRAVRSMLISGYR